MATQSLPKIEVILMEFSHQGQEYVLFTLETSSKEYLFFQNEAKTVRSLFFGHNFSVRIPSLRKNTKNECIECSLGVDIEGGISIDGKDQVEFGISVEEANSIIDGLKTYSTLVHFEIPYFN